ncbi:MAG: MCE family protein [Gammaproteobacteria bacterium]|uniref:MCE family protein n=1 Tax=Candidatus Thiopontia autotrophica TaxID=2841688 RepID=A0A8J6TQ45_9GAMM|nr:MCE family protein [Candidatus Thiopontia autotrophica]MBL6969033.1 MCE family protein [Gammaproteobacteria bacterium]
MTEEEKQKLFDDIPDALLERRRGFSIIWVIPLIVVLMAGWLTVTTISEYGPEISITFQNGDGLEVGKTRIRYKNIEVGIVEHVRFSDDKREVIVEARMDKGTKSFLGSGAKFWIVRPQISLREVSALGTLFSGSYIALIPGDGSPQEEFAGLEQPPISTAETSGRKFVLRTANLNSIEAGTPVYFRGIHVGDVLSYKLADDNSILVHIFISSPYHRKVDQNSYFWNVGETKLTLSADGLQLKTDSLETLLYGGIAFDSPDSADTSAPADDGGLFILYENKDSASRQRGTKKTSYVTYFDRSIRGLKIGAPVEFKGIRIGSVADIRMEIDSKESTILIPVLVDIDAEIVANIVRVNGSTSPEVTMDFLMNSGLRARLSVDSYLTGQLFIDMVLDPESNAHVVGYNEQYPEIPTLSSATVDDVVSAIAAILKKIQGLPIEDIGQELLETAQGTNRLVNSSEIQTVGSSLQHTLASLDELSIRLRSNSKSMESDVVKTSAMIRSVLQQTETTIKLMNNILDPGSPVQYQLNEMTTELTAAARSMRDFIEYLERNPQVLIHGQGGIASP